MPYLGLGITATNKDRLSFNFPDTDFAGAALFAGCEFPGCVKQLVVDPYVRWEFNLETDYTYSYVCFGANLVWKLF